jgi:HEPN domain-containing protein
MMLGTDLDHLPWPVQKELHHVAAILFETFEEIIKGACSDHRRKGRILAIILHGQHVREEWAKLAPAEAFQLIVIVNHGRLARSEGDWRIVRDRLQRAWEFGEISRPVRLSVSGLDGTNRAVMAGVPHFVSIAEQGIALYQMEGFRLETPRHLPARERAGRSVTEFLRWHRRGNEFLSGAHFYCSEGNAPLAAMLLHQACEHFYLCVLWAVTLHGPRTHALDVLRDAAEALDNRLREAWPRENYFERRAFGCIRRAYVEVRYGRSYRISPEELIWAFKRVKVLQEIVIGACADHYGSLLVGPPIPMLSLYDAPVVAGTLPPDGGLPALRDAPPKPRQGKSVQVHSNRLRPGGRFWRSNRFMNWVYDLLEIMVALSFFVGGAGAALLWTGQAHLGQGVQSEPADPSAVLDFDIKADSMLGAVEKIASRAGYRTATNDVLWEAGWAGSYRAKATTFDALSDVLYGSGLCPAISADTVTVRSCNKTSPPVAATVEYETKPDGGLTMKILR